MKTISAAAHVCPECAVRIEQLTAAVLQLEDENRNLNRLEEALRRKDAWLAAVLANSAEGVLLTGPGRRILRVVRGLTGFAPGEMQGALVESVVIPEDQAILLNGYQDLLGRRCKKAEFEVRARGADGSIQYLAGTLTDMLDDPDVQAIVANYSDVTRHKRA
jgi:PAS domain S-box-containing protein